MPKTKGEWFFLVALIVWLAIAGFYYFGLYIKANQCEQAGGILVSGKCLDPKAIIKIKGNKDAD